MTLEEIGRIVLAERERCAKIAEKQDEEDGVDRDWHSACKTIAAAIRKDPCGIDLAEARRNYLDEAKRLGIHPTEVREYPK